MLNEFVRKAAYHVGTRLVRFGLGAATTAPPAPKTVSALPAQPEPGVSDNSQRIEQELTRYKTVENVHDLPQIFHFWSLRYVQPKLEAVFGIIRINEFYVKYILKYHQEHPGERVRIASIGAGNADIEVQIAHMLRQRGLSDFTFYCIDINGSMLERGREMAAREGLGDHFEFVQSDAARWAPGQPISVVMAHHSLHHIPNLEEVFASIARAIGSKGYFLTCDMIGRNGHLRWPEALTIIHDIWREMPDRYKYNHQLNRFEPLYENWDCSGEGFEGVRAQDILPILVREFHFESFVAYGNLPDIFVDRGFGHNFDEKIVEDQQFIDRIGALNDKLITEGKLKPTQMMAAMRTVRSDDRVFWKNWSPEFCVRRP